MDLRQLRYFVTVAETRHFGQAAERLHIAQSPLSQAIRQLEAHLGTPLFDRTTRRVDLTAAGEALRPEAIRILESVAAARQQVEHVAAGHIGSVRCGVTGLATYSQLPRLVRLLTEKLPGLTLSFSTDMLTPAQEQALLDHRIDVGVLRPPVSSPALCWRTLARERFVVAVSREHPLAGSAPIPLGDLRDEAFVLYSAPGSVVDAAVGRACRAAGFAPRRTHSAGETSVVLALVAAGVGVALLPESVLALSVDDVRYVRVTDDVHVDLALAWRRDDPSAAVARLVETVEDAGLLDGPAEPAPSRPDPSRPDPPRPDQEPAL